MRAIQALTIRCSNYSGALSGHPAADCRKTGAWKPYREADKIVESIRAWLRALELEQYVAAFESNDIDIALLPQVDDQTLKDIGIASAGHRLRLRAAIRQLEQPLDSSQSNAATPPVVQGDPSSAPSAERRQVTVMFCDLVGSTALSTQMDPEDLRDVIAAYQKSVSETVQRFDGFVAKYMGDGVLVYFGYPRAHEDDAERATRAAERVNETETSGIGI